MKTAQRFASAIDRLPAGKVFAYADVICKPDEKEAAIKALNRMTAAGKLAKLSKGRYYKPEASAFGALPPNQSEIVKDLLEKNGQVVGYLTGYGIYNRLGLTSQVSDTIQIGRNDARPALKRGRYKVAFVRQKNAITRENIPLLQLLDAIRHQKKIPDASPEAIGRRLLALLKNLSRKEKKSLIELAAKYPPSTRAFLGAALDEIGDKSLTQPLRASLNPISAYKLPAAKVLKFAAAWNIK